MKKLKAVIVDDEPNDIDYAELIINEHCRDVEVAGKARNAMQGVRVVQEVKPDLVILDVEMPNGNGFDMLECLPHRTFEVIFVTAYNHYAIQAIKASALDYILKPINIKEFTEAIEKVKERRATTPVPGDKYDRLLNSLKDALKDKISVKTSGGTEYVSVEDIVHIKGEGSYSRLYLFSGAKIMVARDLKEFEEELKNYSFYRTHKSHLINLKYIKKYAHYKDGGQVTLKDDSVVLVSRRRKEEFLKLLAEYME